MLNVIALVIRRKQRHGSFLRYIRVWVYTSVLLWFFTKNDKYFISLSVWLLNLYLCLFTYKSHKVFFLKIRYFSSDFDYNFNGQLPCIIKPFFFFFQIFQ